MVGDYHKYFLIEAGELLDRMTAAVARVRDGSPEQFEVRNLMRMAHTMKGAAHVVEETQIAGLAHELEDVLDAYTEANTLPSEVLHRVLQIIASLSQLAVKENRPADQPPVPDTSTSASETAGQNSTVRVELQEVQNLMAAINEASTELASLEESTAALATASAAAAAVAQRLRAKGNAVSSVEGQTRRMVEQLSLSLESLERKIALGLQAAARELQQASTTSAQLRLNSIDSVESSLRRAVLTAAEALGKNVTFRMEAHAKRIDAQMLSSLRDPLLHMVRNAVAHGIESPAVRQSVGKSPVGEVRIRCLTEGGTLTFTCEDDGQGIDVQALREVLVQRGVVQRGVAEAETDTELMQRIFTPGVSTTKSADEVSGRGFGMDVVQEAVQRLHGTARVFSTPGRGTRIELRIPLNIYSTPVVECEAGSTRFGVPAESVATVMQFQDRDIVHTEDGRAMAINGRLVTVVKATRLFGEGSTSSRSRKTAVVLHDGRGNVALEVDRVIGTKVVIQKPLPKFARAKTFVGGASIDPRGIPEIVLDPGAIVSAPQLETDVIEAGVRRKPVLVIDDSLTTRTLEQSILETAGYTVEVASSAEEGLQKAMLRDYGLFLVDVEMPGMDGFEFIRSTKRNPALRGVPCVLVTSRNADEDKARGMEAGAADYIVKGDFNQQYLLSRIAELIQK